MPRTLRLVLPFAAGGIAATGFAPLDLWPLTVLGIAVLAWMIEAAPGARAAAMAGWRFGIAHFTVGLAWIATAFTYQAAMPAWLGWVTVVLLSMVLALYPALAAWLARRAPVGQAARVGILAAAWMLAEWLRGHLLSGFAWDPIGAAWLSAGGVAQGAALIGAIGLSGVMIVAGGIVARGWVHNRVTGAMFFGAVLAAAMLSGALVPPPAPSTGPLVHLVQPNIGQEAKYDDPEAHIALYSALSKAAMATNLAREPSIVIWSESSVLDIVEEDPAVRARLASILGSSDLLLFGGVALVRDAGGVATAATNSLYALDAYGRLRGRYDKAHLVPLGEYLPARPLMRRLGLARLTPGDMDFLPGPGPRTLALPGFPDAGVQICYEIVFPAAVVDEAHRPAWIVNISNDAWFGAWGPPQHLAQARLRAIEEGLPIARATPTGISAMIDARGRLLGAIGQHRVAALTLRLPRPLPPTPFARWGHATTLVFGLLLIAGSVGVFRRT